MTFPPESGAPLRRLDQPFGERPVDFAPDRGEAAPERGGDLPVAIAGDEEVQTGFRRSIRLARRAFAAARASARWEREEGSSVTLVSGAAISAE